MLAEARARRSFIESGEWRNKRNKISEESYPAQLRTPSSFYRCSVLRLFNAMATSESLFYLFIMSFYHVKTIIYLVPLSFLNITSFWASLTRHLLTRYHEHSAATSQFVVTFLDILRYKLSVSFFGKQRYRAPRTTACFRRLPAQLWFPFFAQ